MIRGERAVGLDRAAGPPRPPQMKTEGALLSLATGGASDRCPGRAARGALPRTGESGSHMLP